MKRKWTPEQRKLLARAGREEDRDVARERLYQARKALAGPEPGEITAEEKARRERDLFAYQFMLLRTELEIIAYDVWVGEAAYPFARRLLKLLEASG